MNLGTALLNAILLAIEVFSGTTEAFINALHTKSGLASLSVF